MLNNLLIPKVIPVVRNYFKSSEKKRLFLLCPERDSNSHTIRMVGDFESPSHLTIVRVKPLFPGGSAGIRSYPFRPVLRHSDTSTDTSCGVCVTRSHPKRRVGRNLTPPHHFASSGKPIPLSYTSVAIRPGGAA